MAFGDLAQSIAENSDLTATSQSISVNWGSTPTTDNLLLCFCGSTSGNTTITAKPSGFTELVEQTGNDGGWWAGWRQSTGDEVSASITWSGTTAGIHIVLIEIEFDGTTLATPTGSEADSNNYLASAVTSINCGSVTPAVAGKNVVVFGAGVDSEQNFFTGRAFSNSPTVLRDLIDQNAGAWAVAALVNQTGVTTSTYSTTDTGDQGIGYAWSFSGTVAAGPVTRMGADGAPRAPYAGFTDRSPSFNPAWARGSNVILGA